MKKIYHALLCRLFILTGMNPWSTGYGAYKEARIKKVLADKTFQDDHLESRYGYRLDERIIEYPWLFSRLPAAAGKLLDAGSVLNHEYLLAQPALSNKKIFISTLAPESACYAHRGISYVYEDLRDASFKDQYFDWIVSLSTLEHIGLDNTLLYTSDTAKKENAASDYLQVVRELHRMLKPGGRLFLSVPFGQAKNHGWFQVFDSAMLDALIRAFAPAQIREFHYRYAPDGWRISTRNGSKDATCFDINAQKTYDSDFAAFSRAVVCLEMVKS